jgi:hypothetical protein
LDGQIDDAAAFAAEAICADTAHATQGCRLRLRAQNSATESIGGPVAAIAAVTATAAGGIRAGSGTHGGGGFAVHRNTAVRLDHGTGCRHVVTLK